MQPTLEATSSLARTWLKRCKEEHPACQRSDNPSLPKRVIDVEFDTMHSPRLYESQGETAPYLALSYCWGKKGNLTTTPSTLVERTRGIPWDILPTTFQEAITLTRKLGFRYIWIDALCIIQDDSDLSDWELESNKMASTYENAALILSATGSDDVNGGLLRPRASLAKNHQVFNINWSDSTGKSYKIYVRKRLHHSSIIPDVTYPDRDSPLLSRAWAFQERLLAMRTLHFLPDEFLWECRSQFWCECLSSRADLKWMPPPLQASAYSRAMCSPLSADLTQLWQNVIASYTNRQITNIKDKLPALSGIAKSFEQAGMGTYLAGLWLKDLSYHLMWKADVPFEYKVPTLHQNIALHPSWSWTSTPHPIKWASRDLRYTTTEVNILNVDCRAEGMNPLGFVSSGSIRMEARVTEAWLELSSNKLWKFSDKNSMSRGALSLFSFREPIKDRREAIFYPDGYLEKSLGSRSAMLNEKWRDIEDGKSITCILMYSVKKLALQSVNDEHIHWGALVVKPVKDREDVYKRIGIAEGSINPHYECGWFDGIETRVVEIV